MFVCDEKKFVYVGFTKSGSSSIYALLTANFNGQKFNRSWRQIKEEHKGYTSFCVVRNPYSRMVSWWWSICKVGGDRYGHKRELANAGLTESLEDFITLWSTKPEAATSQSLIIETVSRFDHVIHLEKIKDELYELPFMPFGVEIPKFNAKSDKPHWKELLTPKAIELINTHWEDDFKLLGYENEMIK